jgi:translation initiation factor 2-alpha kinase 4
MPHHPKKTATNALKNASPRAEKKKHVSPEPASIASPSVVTTNYQEIHQNEVEALRSIYGDDFEEVHLRPSAWHVSFVQLSIFL